MSNKIIILLFITIVVAMQQPPASAEVIFEDDFNAHTNWFPVPSGATNDMSPAGSAYICDYGQDCSAAPPPSGWTNYKTAGLWWPPLYKATLEITDQVHAGISGKSFRFYNESNIGSSGDGWGNDGMLTKLLDSDHQEIFVRFKFRAQPGWQYTLTDDMLIKMFRVGHYDRTGSLYTYFPGGNTAPISLFDLKFSNIYGIRAQVDGTYRCDPQATDYSCPGLSVGDILWPASVSIQPTDSGQFADGNWHVLDFHFRMNTYSGGAWNSDGVYSFIYNGTTIVSRNNINWKRTGSAENIGWNVISLGGNNHNLYAEASEHAEQWYAIDDVVVSTTPIPYDYEIGGSTPPTVLPTAYRIPGGVPYGIVQ